MTDDTLGSAAREYIDAHAAKFREIIDELRAEICRLEIERIAREDRQRAKIDGKERQRLLDYFAGQAPVGMMATEQDDQPFTPRLLAE